MEDVEFWCPRVMQLEHIHTQSKHTYKHKGVTCIKLFAFELAGEAEILLRKTRFSNGSKRGFPFACDVRGPTQTQSALHTYIQHQNQYMKINTHEPGFQSLQDSWPVSINFRASILRFVLEYVAIYSFLLCASIQCLVFMAIYCTFEEMTIQVIQKF